MVENSKSGSGEGPGWATPGPTRLKAAIAFHPLTADRWDDLVRLFGPRGACGGCWCMVWRLPPKEWNAGKKDGGRGNRRRLKSLVTRGEAPGVLGYANGEPIAWCVVAPRAKYVALARSRVLAPLDDEPVWSISCLFVAKGHRRRGVGTRAIAAATELARSRGAKIVEAYPIVATMESTPDPAASSGRTFSGLGPKAPRSPRQ